MLNYKQKLDTVLGFRLRFRASGKMLSPRHESIAQVWVEKHCTMRLRCIELEGSPSVAIHLPHWSTNGVRAADPPSKTRLFLADVNDSRMYTPLSGIRSMLGINCDVDA